MHTLKSVGVMSVAKIMGIIYGCMGLLAAPIFLLVGLFPAGNQQNSPFSGFLGVGLAIMAPILYGVMGFVFGAIGALLYNLFARLVGGFELQLEPKSPMAVAPYPIVPNSPGV